MGSPATPKGVLSPCRSDTPRAAALWSRSRARPRSSIRQAARRARVCRPELLADCDCARRRLSKLVQLDDLAAEWDERSGRHLEAANAERNPDDRQAQQRPED